MLIKIDIFVLDESDETNSEIQIKKKKEDTEFREPKTTVLPKKDIFRPYCLPDPDIKPLNSSYNVRIFYNFFLFLKLLIV